MATLWIIDGYNFIRQSRNFSFLEAKNHDEGKREALQWLGRFSELTGEKVCVVFDAYSGLQKEMNEESLFGIQVLSSRGGYTADEEIIELAKKRGEGAIVVSSDRAVQEGAVRGGSSILNSNEFEREVRKILDREDSEELPSSARQKGKSFHPPKRRKKGIFY